MDVISSALVIISTIVGILLFVNGVMEASSAPQQAAAAAMGIACGVLPYILLKVRYCSFALTNQEKIIELLEKEIEVKKNVMPEA